MHTPEPRLPGVSTKEAAIILGTSETDVRRRIRAGRLKAESIPRPGGTLLRVLLDATPDTRQPIESAPTPATSQDAPAETALLLDRLEAAHERERAQADRIAALERENGRLTSDATHTLKAAQIERERRLEAEAEVTRLRRPWWRRILDG